MAARAGMRARLRWLRGDKERSILKEGRRIGNGEGTGRDWVCGGATSLVRRVVTGLSSRACNRVVGGGARSAVESVRR